jgi:PAS domain S-box-containing protein
MDPAGGEAAPGPRRVRLLVGAVLVALGAVVLVGGWVADVDGLRDLGASASMKPVTALGVTIAGTRLLVERRDRLTLICSGALLALGVLALADRGTDGALHLGNLLADPGTTPAGGLPSTETALAFAALGGAGLLRNRRPGGAAVADGLALAVAVANLLAVTFAVLVDREVRTATGVAIHTAIALTLAAGLALVAERGPILPVWRGTGVGSIWFRRAGPAAALAIVVIGAAVHAASAAGVFDATTYEAAVLVTSMLVVGLAGGIVAARRLDAEAATNDELTQTVARLRATLESAADAYVAVDADGVVVDWNGAATALFGYERGEAIGALLAELIVPPAERGAHDGAIATYRGGPSEVVGQRRELAAVNRAGEELPVEVAVWQIPGEGPDRRYGAFLRDLTERRAATSALAVSEARFRLLSEASTEGIAVLEDGVISEVNLAMSGLFGMPEGAFAGRSPVDLLVPEEHDRVTRRLGDGVEVPMVVRARRSDGTTFDALVSSRQAEVGGRVRRITTIQDISELRRAQQDLRGLLDGVPAMVGYWDADLRNRMANHAYLDYFGIEPEAMVGRPMGEIIGEDLFVRNLPYAEAALRGEEQVFDRTIIDAHGESRSTQTTYRPDIVDGEVRGFFALVIDITARRRAEDALRSALDDLRRSNRDLDDFAAAASHDLKAPLVSIGGFASLLARTHAHQLDDDGLEWLQFIANGVRRLEELIDDLLTYAQVGQATPTGDVELGDVLADVISRLDATIRDSGGTIHITGDAPKLVANRSQMVQLFQNLLANALKFRSDAPPRVEVDFGPMHDGVVEVEVRDNGIGIDPRYAEKVFGMFQRLNNRQDFPGTGVGLALCRRIVEQHSGTILVVPKNPPGTTIRIALPTGA